MTKTSLTALALSLSVALLACNTTDEYSSEPSDECTTSDDCPDDQFCIDDQCIECVDDTDCGDDRCSDGVCVNDDDNTQPDDDCLQEIPDSPVCGACDLGTLTCEGVEDEHPRCDEPDIPSWDQSCDDLVFVSAHDGTSSASGTKEDPLDSIASGLTEAAASDAAAIIVDTTGSYHGPIELPGPISIVGGYNRHFEAASSDRTHIAVESSDGDLIGVAIDDAEDLLLQGLHIDVDDATSPGASVYGLHLTDSRAHLTNLRVTAGAGADGDDGAAGTAGSAGGDGDEILNFGVNDTQFPAIDDWDQLVPGGTNPQCPTSTEGGTGGSPEVFGGQSGTTHFPDSGGDAELASGGNALVPESLDWFDDVEGALPTSSDASLRHGEDGPTADTGDAGSAGSHTPSFDDQGLWQVDSASGGHGASGADGSGGGGGAGSIAFQQFPFTRGSFGGGGAGGCGGEGGDGGDGGGASVAMMIFDSDVTAVSSTFTSSPGGQGGQGGDGGTGGQGGVGGSPTEQFSFVNAGGEEDQASFESLDDIYIGGFGGDGAQGGTGGAGGGGAGGPSIGVVCHNGVFQADESVQSTSEGSAPGGTSPGQEGDAGFSAESYGCE